MKVFNVNDCVKIKLTEAEIAILKARHDNILKPYVGEFKTPVVDENGYTQMQMWEVMQIFGNYMYNGNLDIPFETNIAISEEYLKDQEKGKSL